MGDIVIAGSLAQFKIEIVREAGHLRYFPIEVACGRKDAMRVSSSYLFRHEFQVLVAFLLIAWLTIVSYDEYRILELMYRDAYCDDVWRPQLREYRLQISYPGARHNKDALVVAPWGLGCSY